MGSGEEEDEAEEGIFIRLEWGISVEMEDE